MDKKKRRPNIPARCEIRNETAEGSDLYLYGTIEDDDALIYYYEDEIENLITPGKVRSLIEGQGTKEINIHLSSNGGSVYGSVAIMNYLKSIPNTVNIIIDSVAFSGASIISMAGNTVSMYSNSMMMIHKASTSFYGNSLEFQEMITVLDKFDEVVLNSYLDRFTGTEEELRKLIENETYLSAKDCQSLGLCDIIIGEEQAFDTLENISNKVNNLLTNIKNVEPTKEVTDPLLVDPDKLKDDPDEDKKDEEELPQIPEDVEDIKPKEPEVIPDKVDEAPKDTIENKKKSILDKFKKEKGAI